VQNKAAAVALAALTPAALARCEERTVCALDASLTTIQNESLRARMPHTVAAWQAMDDAQRQEKLDLAKEGGQESHFNIWHASTLARQLAVLRASAAAHQSGAAFEGATALHALSCHHADLLQEYAWLGCFHCQAIFSPSDVSEFINAGQTALCPICPVNAVIPLVQHATVSELQADDGPQSSIGKLLRMMHERWLRPSTSCSSHFIGVCITAPVQ
jgi:hypothetical protein